MGTLNPDRDACGTGFLADVQGRSRDDLLPLALTALRRLAHRGAVDADGRTGDGAGVTTRIPHAMLRPELEARGLGSLAPDDLGVGALFLPRNAEARRRGCEVLAECVRRQGLALLGFRDVPLRDEALGEKALRSRPDIVHALVARPEGITGDEFERRLYRARREAEALARAERLGDGFYVVSLSHRTLVYKALVRAVDLADFYPDLCHPDFATSFALFHQRFSTNTVPCWAMTQPFRLLAHNGEINTIQGNRSWMRAREPGLRSARLGLSAAALHPILPEGTSDSASLDEALALVAQGGRTLVEGVTLLMPPAWESDQEMAPEVRAVFQEQACTMEPWDGPAFLVFTDGRVVGAALDRNGLRPARSLVTTDGLVLVASEAGLLDVREERVLARGRLGPGDIVAVDLQARRFLDRDAIHRHLAALQRPAGRSGTTRVSLAALPGGGEPQGGEARPDLRVLRALGYTREELLLILGPMYKEGLEPLGSMGDDTPLAVLSARPRLLFSYFKQRFAQVTNPPIDPLREAVVMSLATHLGPRGDLLARSDDAPRVQLQDPLLEPADVRALEVWGAARWRVERLSLLFAARDGAAGFAVAIEELLAASEEAVRQGATLLVLSDKGIDGRQAALPSLLAVSAVHQHLVRRGLRLQTSLLAEVGDARDDHHLAALVGFGTDAVCPYLALQTVADAVRRSDGADVEVASAQARYRRTLLKGLLKILAKMGVSTVRSYHGAQLFEAVGIGEAVIDRHFTGTPSAVGGVGLEQIAADVLARHRDAFAGEPSDLEEGGFHRYRKNGEAHAFEPPVVKALHAAIRTGERLDYRRYADLVHAREPLALRDLVEFRPAASIDLSEVEPVESILPRFMTAAMSLGALGPEAQQTLAVAMNRMGARSNSGEGGEPAELYWKVLPGGDRVRNRIKQVASARFGVTAEYLMSADELQIKMAQGSKPGEGGQLPGHKVAPHIARVRHATPGTTLISPPPHHDIYSIEDLAQLIYDLKRVNPAASVSVKLVSSAGIGTIAAGVAKAHADAIQVSGHDGGTGASPLSSIKNAGTPWELGLADVQRALVEGGLRGRVRLQVDGGLKTGRDVVIAAMLGAEEFGFGTAALVAAGCVMARQCHLNTCPAGIATQREDLRAKFSGRPEDVIRFFTAVAEEVREILALLGARRLEEVIGRAELLEPRAPARGDKAGSVCLRRLLHASEAARSRRWEGTRNDPPATGHALDEAVLARLRFGAGTIAPLAMDLAITNADRSVGARVAGELAGHLRGRRLPAGTIDLRYRGSAGQSFAAFCTDGLRLVLEGEANDYVGKGMSGGEIVMRPRARDLSRSAVIAGNTCLYGATGGRAFIAGRAGERFAVRNSGAVAVVEGTGDHACEYMTAGVVVILGPTGRNLGAGMSGGLALVLDEEGALGRRYNPELVALEEAIPFEEEEWLRRLIALHVEATHSSRAREVLEAWSDWRPLVRRLAPRALSGPVVLPSLDAEHVSRRGRRRAGGARSRVRRGGVAAV